jgi:hypothetical protein
MSVGEIESGILGLVVGITGNNANEGELEGAMLRYWVGIGVSRLVVGNNVGIGVGE